MFLLRFLLLSLPNTEGSGDFMFLLRFLLFLLLLFLFFLVRFLSARFLRDGWRDCFETSHKDGAILRGVRSTVGMLKMHVNLLHFAFFQCPEAIVLYRSSLCLLCLPRSMCECRFYCGMSIVSSDGRKSDNWGLQCFFVEFSHFSTSQWIM